MKLCTRYFRIVSIDRYIRIKSITFNEMCALGTGLLVFVQCNYTCIHISLAGGTKACSRFRVAIRNELCESIFVWRIQQYNVCETELNKKKLWTHFWCHFCLRSHSYQKSFWSSGIFRLLICRFVFGLHFFPIVARLALYTIFILYSITYIEIVVCMTIVGNVIGFKVKWQNAVRKNVLQRNFRNHYGIVERKITRAIENKLHLLKKRRARERAR